MEINSVSISIKERKKLFFTELVRAGISFDDAYIVSEIVASYKSNEVLTLQEKRLVIRVCQQWRSERQRAVELQQRFADLGMTQDPIASSETASSALDTPASNKIQDFHSAPIHQAKVKRQSPEVKENLAQSKRPTVMAIAWQLAKLSHSSVPVGDVLIVGC